jgi:branched-subunit amino acid ABC-type transport system permease component
LVASGLTLSYGVLRVLNFAHGAFFAYGCIITALLIGTSPATLGDIIGATLVSAVALAVIGAVVYLVVFRQTKDEMAGLLASFALLLTMVGLAESTTGSDARSITLSDNISGRILFVGVSVARYDIVLIVVTVLVGLALNFLVRRTWAGRVMRAVAHDPEMAAALGYRASRVALGVFAVAAALAGVAGAIMAPRVAVDPFLAHSFILPAFAAILIGGLGSIAGALLASLGLGLAESLAIHYVPPIGPYIVYVFLALALLVRPNGILAARVVETAR